MIIVVIVQISTDGPFHNVLKIKPPMCFSKQDAKTLFQAIDKALKEYYQRGNEQATTQE
jgi:4-aminobutyrate aminotransferase-like enzyme